MKSNFLYLGSLIGILLFSCNKSDNDNNNPPAPARDWFKLKTVLYNSLYNGSPNSNDSTSIEIDSTNNKIVFKQYGSNSSGKDTSVETYTYNSNYQLVLYEHVDTYDRLYISRMEFVRDANGQLTKVLSGYKNGLMANSEGSVKYDKRGDTTFITYLDSAKKHPQGYPDAQDFYQVALLNNKVVYQKDLAIKSTGSDSSINKFEYDAAGNLISDTYQYGKSTPVVYTYQRGSEVPAALQKFITQWAGDLVWFNRTKLFGFMYYIGYDRYIAGNVVQSVKKNNAAYISFTNGFDANGNLNKISYQSTGGSTTVTYTQQFRYRP
jgi:YD repeat-containing protein